MSVSISPSPLITVLQSGPCWCRGDDRPGGSFDLMRYRVSDPVPGLDRNLLVVTDRILAGSRGSVARTLESVGDPKLVVATSSCPAAASFWTELAGGWLPIEDLVEPHARVSRCITGRPEALLATVIETLWQSVAATRPAAVVG